LKKKYLKKIFGTYHSGQKNRKMYTTELKNRKKNLECQYKNSLKKEEKGFKRYDKTSYNEKKS